MSNFVSIYQRVVLKKSLRDDITVTSVSEQLPTSVQESLKHQEYQKKVLQKIKKEDDKSALTRLERIREQLRKPSTDAS